MFDGVTLPIAGIVVSIHRSLEALLIVGLVGVLSFAAGLARRKFGPAPAAATAAIMLGYVILLAVVPSSVVEGQDVVFWGTYSFAGWFALLEVALVWAGAWLSTAIWQEEEPVHMDKRFMLLLAIYVVSLVVITALVPHLDWQSVSANGE